MTYHIKEVKRTNENVIKIKSCTLFPSKRNVTRFINLIHEILFWGGWNTVSKAARKYCGLIQTLSPQVGIVNQITHWISMAQCQCIFGLKTDTFIVELQTE